MAVYVWQIRQKFKMNNSSSCHFHQEWNYKIEGIRNISIYMKLWISRKSIVICSSNRVQIWKGRDRKPRHYLLTLFNNLNIVIIKSFVVNSIHFRWFYSSFVLNKKFYQDKNAKLDKWRSRNILLIRNSQECLHWITRNRLFLWWVTPIFRPTLLMHAIENK